MPSREDFERMADEVAADVVKLEKHIAVLRRQEKTLRRLAIDGLEDDGTNEVLHKRLRTASVNEPSMEKSHRLRISEGHKGDADPFLKAIRAKGYSQNSLAKAVGVNQAVLSLHRKKVRKIPLSRAKDIEKRTGWPADAKHWPVGIVSDGE